MKKKTGRIPDKPGFKKAETRAIWLKDSLCRAGGCQVQQPRSAAVSDQPKPMQVDLVGSNQNKSGLTLQGDSQQVGFLCFPASLEIGAQGLPQITPYFQIQAVKSPPYHVLLYRNNNKSLSHHTFLAKNSSQLCFKSDSLTCLK